MHEGASPITPTGGDVTVDKGAYPTSIEPTYTVEESMTVIFDWLNAVGTDDEFNLYGELIDHDNEVGREARRLWAEATSADWYDEHFEQALYELWSAQNDPYPFSDVPPPDLGRDHRTQVLVQSYLNDEIDDLELIRRIGLDVSPLAVAVKKIVLDHHQALTPAYIESRRWQGEKGTIRDWLLEALVVSYDIPRGYRGPRRPGTAHILPTTLPTVGGQRRRGDGASLDPLSDAVQAELRRIMKQDQDLLDALAPVDGPNILYADTFDYALSDEEIIDVASLIYVILDDGHAGGYPHYHRQHDDGHECVHKKEHTSQACPDPEKRTPVSGEPGSVVHAILKGMTEPDRHSELVAPEEIEKIKRRLTQLEKEGRLPSESDLTGELETNVEPPPDLEVKTRAYYDDQTGEPIRYHNWEFCSNPHCKKGHW